MSPDPREAFEPEEPTLVPPSRRPAGPSDPPARTDAPTHTDEKQPPKSPVPPDEATLIRPGGNPASPEEESFSLADDPTLIVRDPQAVAQQRALARGPAKPPVKVFGDYELLDTIARGGMGVVYKARQRKLNRTVALKMILAGQFADQQDIARFYAEAEAAANLRHPNIVVVHEVGDVDGQHFFSMDYIDGKSLAEMVRENPLSARAAATFARQIAATMEFAHERGILHRDLKPSNILVDRGNTPLITDFGLAKQVSSGSQLTMSGAVVGTPSYMPPEQAAGDSDAVGPQSDIYSIGAILYELLTGRPPFRAATPFETIRQVLTVEPVSPQLINPNVPKDLETICLKCLQKERHKRYPTSQELADELNRFLCGEPIRARPISRVARTWRWCRRNPRLATAIGGALLSLLVAFAASTTGYVLTRRSQQQSEESFRQAMQTVNDLFTSVSENTLLNQPGMQPLRRELLQRALDYYERFLRQRGQDPSVRNELAETYFRVGLITEVLASPAKALPSYERAYAMQKAIVAQQPEDQAAQEALGNTLNALGTVWVKLLDLDRALALYRESLDVRQALARIAPANADYQRTLANSYMNLGLAEWKAGRLNVARTNFEQAQDIRRQALAQHAGHARLRRDLGKGHYNLATLADAENDVTRAESDYRQAVTVFEELTREDPGDLEYHQLLAICYRLLGDLKSTSAAAAAAEEFYRHALNHMEPLVRRNPDVVEYQMQHAGLLLNLGELEREQGQHSAALDHFAQACGIVEPLVEQFPGVPRYRLDLAVALRAMAQQQAAIGEREAAATNLDRSRDLLQRLVQEFPDDDEFSSQLEATQAAKSQLAGP